MKQFKELDTSRFMFLESDERLHQLQVLHRQTWIKWKFEDGSVFPLFKKSAKSIRLKALVDKINAHIEWMIQKTIPDAVSYCFIARGSERYIDIQMNRDQKFLLIYIVDSNSVSGDSNRIAEE